MDASQGVVAPLGCRFTRTAAFFFALIYIVKAHPMSKAARRYLSLVDGRTLRAIFEQAVPLRGSPSLFARPLCRR